MYTDTINSVSKLLSSGTGSKPVVTISLDNPQSTYTTFSPLSGTVTIIAPTTTVFSTIDITLEGSTSTYVEKMTTSATNYRSTANHTFLKLVMPITLSSYPQDKTLTADQVYKFPFNFAVPNQLLPQSCTHACTSKHVHFAHLSLPPSMGNSGAQHPDLCPDMVKINYGIKAKLSKVMESGKPQKLCHASLTLNIIHASPEAPPMSIDVGDKDWSLVKSKGLKRGMFKGKLGRITLKAEQPRDFMLSVPPVSQSPQALTSSSSSSSSVSSSANFSPFASSSDSFLSQTSQRPSSALTHLKLTLNFTPDSSHPTAQPPRLSSLTSKLRSSTFYAARAAISLPLRSQMSQIYDPNSGLYENTMSLPSRNLASVTWTKDEPSEASLAPPLYEVNAPTMIRERRSSDSGYSSDREPEVSEGESATSYTARISLPLSLPCTITWLPTFHSCLVSRTYTLELSLSFTNGTIVPTTSLSLKVPVRIGVLGAGERRGNGNGPAIISLSAPGQSGEDPIEGTHLPPGYEIFVGSGSGMAQRRRGGQISQSMSFPNGVTVDSQDVSRGSLSLMTTGGEFGASFGLTGHGGR